MFNKSIYLFLLFIAQIILFETANSQNTQIEVPKIVMQSPNAISLGKYGDYPVDMSTGVPDINIPLYTVKSGSLELPISISYHSGGIKVDEESSFVGLGWTLNAGGIVTRVIKDRDDIGSYGFSSRHNQLPDYNSIEAGVIGGVGNNSELVAEYLDYDKEPDLFIVNANGINSKFCMDNNGNYGSLDYEPYKYSVDYANNLIIVIDKFGNTYRFGKGLDGSATYETTTENSGSTIITNGSPTAWYLTEIISADNADVIKFTYETLPYTLHAPGTVDRWTFEANPTYGVMDESGFVHQGISYGTRDVSIPNVRILNSITFKNGSIQFSLIDDRQDISGENLHQNARIAGFSVLDNNNNLVKKVVFDNNDYFNRTGAGNSIGNGNIFPYESKSLKMDGVQLLDNQNNLTNKYTFNYNTTLLPARNTTPQDLWGFYNGMPSTDFIPQTFYTDNSPGLNQPTFVGSNRNPDPNYVQAGILQKVTYPTGGYTTYDYEPNYYLKPQQQAGKTQQSRLISCFALNRLATCSPTYYNGAGPSTVYEFTVSEDIGNSNQVSANIAFHFSDYINYNGSPMVAKFYQVDDELHAAIYQQTAAERVNPKTVNLNFMLFKGKTYRFELYTNSVTGSTQSMCNSPFIEAYASYSYWAFSSPQYILPIQAGGLRVKTISNYDANGGLLTKKIYEYGSQPYGSSGIGVGNLISDPNNNFYFYPELYAKNNCDNSLVYCLHFSSNSQTPLGFNHGSPVDYDKITEKTISAITGIANGKTEYYYSKTGMIHEPMDSYEHPYNYFYYPDWESSVLLTKIDYTLNSDGTYQPVQSENNSYTQASEKRIKILKVLQYEPDLYLVDNCVGGGSLVNNPHRFFFYNFYVSVGRNRHTGNVTTTYVNGVPSLTVGKSYSYNSNEDISKITSTDSKNQNLETDLKYTGDLDYPTLISNNMISYRVSTEKFLNGNLVNGEILKYNNDAHAMEYYAIKSTTPVTTPVAYTIKDNLPAYYERKQSFTYSGLKLLEQKTIENSLTTTYLWDYNSSYPVAEVNNASQPDIAYTSFEADSKGYWNNYTGTISTVVATPYPPTGTKYYNLTPTATLSKSVTSGKVYIISYWSKNGAYSITGGTGTSVTGRSFGSWTYYEHKVTASSPTLTISGTGSIDEVRLYPFGAQMETYTYLPLIGISSQCDMNNRITYYEYDNFQRLKLIRDQDNNIIKRFDYQYQQPQ